MCLGGDETHHHIFHSVWLWYVREDELFLATCCLNIDIAEAKSGLYKTLHANGDILDTRDMEF